MSNWKYEYLINQLHRTAYKKHESYVIGSLLHDESLSELKPCTQHFIRRSDNNGYALLDLYYPQIELAIEVDESYHDEHENSDKLRQEIIEQDLICEFFRIKVNEGNVISQINELKEHIKKKVIKFQEEKKFKSWLEPRKLDISKAKNDFSRSLFIKIKGEIHPDDLMARQTGFWRISKSKRDRVNQVIVVHNSVISRIFRDIQWHVSSENSQKVGYKGCETDVDSHVGTVIENWTSQQTITYSDDMY